MSIETKAPATTPAPRDASNGGCLLYYPKCAAGYSSFGCCICSHDCHSSMTYKHRYQLPEELLHTHHWNPPELRPGGAAVRRTELPFLQGGIHRHWACVLAGCTCPAVYPYSCATSCTKDAQQACSSVSTELGVTAREMVLDWLASNIQRTACSLLPSIIG